MDEIHILELIRPIYDNEDFYRSSPFEYDDTALGGQHMLLVGNLCPTSKTLLVRNPFTVTIKAFTASPLDSSE